MLDERNKLCGDSGMKPGDSGGWLYTYDGQFIGIAVEFDSKPKTGTPMCHFIPTEYIHYDVQGIIII